MKRNEPSTTSNSQRGFALPAAVLLITLLAAMALFGVGLVQQEQRTSYRTGARAAAFYAAEIGITRGLDEWATAQAAMIQPGETLLLDEGSLASGASYRAEVTRLDDGGAFNPLYVIQSQGLARDGRSHIASLLVTLTAIPIEAKGAVRVLGGLRMTGTAEVSGFDGSPLAWSDCPLPDSAAIPGIVMTDTSALHTSGAAAYDGQPPLVEDPDTTDAFQFGAMTFAELAAQATITFPNGTRVTGTDPAPSLTADGKCNTADPGNWGDPMNPDRPCGRWFPLIYGAGDLKLTGSGAGQGILLVEGNLDVSGGFEFFGPVIVRGQVKSTGGGFHFHGALTAGSTDVSDQNILSGSTRIAYSACTRRRALTFSPAARPQPLGERPWFASR